MAKTQYLTYYVHLTDAERVDELNGLYPAGLNRAPYNAGPPEGGAAVEFAQPNYPPALPMIEVGQPFVAPSLVSPWFTSDNDFPRNVAVFHKTNWLIRIITFGFGGSTKFYWIAKFVYSPGAAADAPPTEERAKIPKRRWIDGFELPDRGAGADAGTLGGMVSRDASRTIEGYGLAYRAAWNLTQQQSATGPIGGALPNGTWERFYLRPRSLDSAEFWRCTVAAESGAGFSLELTALGQLAVYKNAGGGTKTLIGTVGTFVLNTWYRFDLIVCFTSPLGAGWSGVLKVYVNGALITTATSTGGGLTANARHNYSTLGESRTQTNSLALDLDDWRGTDLPKDKDASVAAWVTSTMYAENDYVASAGFNWRCLAGHTSSSSNAPPNGTYWTKIIDSADWLLGSHAQLVRPTVDSGDTANWTGDPRLLTARPTRSDLPGLTSSTALAPLGLDTDVLLGVATLPDVVGWGGVSVGLYGKRGTASGELGYRIGAGSIVLAAITQATSLSWTVVLYAPENLDDPEAIDDVELHHTKGNSADAAAAACLMAQVDALGVFGREDLPVGTTSHVVPKPMGCHNAPYPLSPWARTGLPVLSPVLYRSGTYVGNGTGKTLEFPAPVHFLCIRPLTSDAGGVRWFSSTLGAHVKDQQAPQPDISPDQHQDLTYVGTEAYYVELGAHAQVNANGVTYQFFAIMDPGARFLLCGAFSHGPSSSGAEYPHTANLPKIHYLGQFALLWGELPGTTTTGRLYLKGPGHAADAASLVGTGTPVAASVTLEEGTIVLGSAAFTTNALAQIAYALWRRSDGNDDPNEARVISIGTYTGDGSASRTITVSPSPGVRPLFAIVQPHNAAAEIRDPSHTGTTSSAYAGGSVHASGYITAGAIDGFSVGVSLNANGIVYEYAVWWGSATAGNGGWSVDGTFEPVESDYPDDDWPPDDQPEEPGELPPGEDEPPAEEPPVTLPEEPDYDPGDPLPGTDLFCVDFTQRLVNLALLRIGVSQQIDAIASELTEAANVARLHVKYDVQTTLRDFPWPFATRYATLVLVGGSVETPVNADWTFSYRRPADCIFERRLVVARGAAINPTPPPFALGTDSGGWLIYCNEATAILEYTARVTCPTYMGDDLFKDAVTWRFAMSLAAPLTRMREKEDYARQMYDVAIRRAYDTLRPGNPGPRPAEDEEGPDVGEGAPAANLAVVNRALVRVGAPTIASLTEQSREAIGARLVFEEELRGTLRDFPWPFATQYATLALVVPEPPDPPPDPPEPLPPANADWAYGYRRPDDCVFERRIVVARGTAVNPTPPPFGLGYDDDGALIFCNEADAVLEYTARPDGAVLLSDSLFRDALAWRLAAVLSTSLKSTDAEAVEQLGRGADATVAADGSPSPKRARRVEREQLSGYAWQMYEAAIRRAYEVIRPGRPGPRPEAVEGAPDADPDAVAANLSVVNLALVRIDAPTIAALTDQSREATAARLVFEDELRSTLRDHPWAFATRYATEFAAEDVDGDPDNPVNPDWIYGYTLPVDCVFARRLVREGTGRKFDPDPDPFRVGTDDDGVAVFFCDIEDANLEYTARLDGAVLRGEALFRDAFAWRLAAVLALSLSSSDPEAVEQIGRGPDATTGVERQPAPRQARRTTRERLAAYAWAKYAGVLYQARVADAREQQQPRGDDDADWILARG